MKKRILRAGLLATGILSLGLLASCDDNDSMNPGSNRTITIENVSEVKDFVQSGEIPGVTFVPSVGHDVILPGESVSIRFHAGKGQSLMFATMYGFSKDWFFAPENPGINLYNSDGSPVVGDVSSQIKLWDNGSKDDVTGNAESKPIENVGGVNASSLMKLQLAYNSVSSEFTLTITNTSGGTANETPFSPGVWAVSNMLGGALKNPAPFYKKNELTSPELTPLAEMGLHTTLFNKTKGNTGIITGFSPALVILYRGDNPIYKLGEKDQGKGLKKLSQFGDISELSDYLKSLPNVKAVYSTGNMVIAPGQKSSVNFTPALGDKIGYVTMFGYSNDWFYSNENEISALSIGNVTSQTSLFDSGTGVDQFPGAGNNQALFGGTPQIEDQVISKVGNIYPVPSVGQIINVTIH